MKKVILSIVVAILALINFSADAEKVGVKLRGDTAQIVTGHDTISISSSLLKNIVSRIDARLNDTLISDGEIVIDRADEDNVDADIASAREFALEKERLLNRRVLHDDSQRTIGFVVSVIVGAIVLIILMALVAYYMHRRAKYRIIEKAIENNYKLPDEMFDHRVIVQQQRPVCVPDAPTTTEQGAPEMRQFSQPPVLMSGNGRSAVDDFFTMIRWNPTARTGLKLIIVGLCLIIFFMSTSIEQLAGVSCIFLLLGAWKLICEYYNNRAMQKQNYNDAPKQPQTPQQPQTPPPFSVNTEENQQK